MKSRNSRNNKSSLRSSDGKVISIVDRIIANAEVEQWGRIQEILEARVDGEGMSEATVAAIRKSGARLAELIENREEYLLESE